MDLGLKDRVAIIGGSSRGIGRAIALRLAAEGAAVKNRTNVGPMPSSVVQAGA